MVVPLKRATFRHAFVFFAALWTCGCQPERVTQANFDRIQMGMKLSEVEAILGKPDSSYQSVVSWKTNHEQTVISVTVDDRGIVTDKFAEKL